MGSRLRRVIRPLRQAALLVVVLPGAAFAICAADCDGNSKVTIDEILKAVGISLGKMDMRVCTSADRDLNGVVSVDELVRAVNVALEGCTVVRPFKSIQQVFTQSCAFSSCHSAVARKGDLVLEHEDLSWDSLVGRVPDNADAKAMGVLRVVPGDPANSFLVRKLRGLGPGDPMPQGGSQLSADIIHMVEDWIARGAPTSEQDCAPPPSTGGQGSHVVTYGSDSTDCGDVTIPTGNYVWEPQPPLEAPAPDEGIQLYVPQRPVDPGTEWETCYTFQPDISDLPTNVIKRQEYRMHAGSHHLLLYMYLGDHPEQYKQGFWPCFAANCTNPGDCPEDSWNKIPIGGTQVAGTRYIVNYPKGVGLPILRPVIIANLHYTNPFQPQQEIYGEAWINLYVHEPGEAKVVLDGIFGIAAPFVEPFQTAVTTGKWKPRNIITRNPVDAAVFQLFGHMHKRGREFTVDVVQRDTCTDTGMCNRSGKECATSDDCDPEKSTEIYRTTQWDNAPVQEYGFPYLQVNKNEELDWQCVHENGRVGDPNYPPKKCSVNCNSCGWNADDQKCHFQDGRVFDLGEPMPLIFGELADDDMCNLFGYFIPTAALDRIGQ